jgi:alpha-galactosidase
VYVRYVQNLYGILAELRSKHPSVEIESCSGGGGRVDLGILRYTDEVWPSDNTDALDRLSIQDGFTHAYAPQTMVAWVTDVPNFLDRRSIPLKFRFLTAMQGALGVGGNLNHWTSQEMQLGTELTALYKTVRSTVQHGRLYRLTSPQRGEVSQVEYVAPDGKQAVLFAYLQSQHYGEAYPTVQLQGLDSAAQYRVHALDPKISSGEEVVSGAVLMHLGVRLDLRGDYDATALVLERLD